MKKKLFAAILIAMICISGCSAQNTASVADETSQAAADTAAEAASQAEAPAESAAEEKTNETAAADLKSVFENIKTQVELPSMVELNDKLLMRYYGLEADICEDYAGGVDSSGIGQDEIVLMKAKDESGAEEIRTALQTRYDAKLSQQQNYNPEEAEKISKCSVETNGLYVTLIISDDAEKIKEIVNNAL